MEGFPLQNKKSPEKKSLLSRISFGKLKKAGLTLLSMVMFNHAVEAQDKTPVRTPKPTTQDSLDLYNNTNELLDFYSVKNKYVDLGTKQIDPKTVDISKENQFGVKNMEDRLKAKLFPWTNRRYESVTDNMWQLIKGFTFGKVQTDHFDSDDKFEISDYYQKVDNNRYKQRELENLKIDMEAPMQLYDNRIEPTIAYRFQNRNDKYDGLRGSNPMYGDISTFYGYDPIAIKPEGMRTKQDWEYLNKKYGTPIPGQSKIVTPNPAPVVKTEQKQIKIDTVKTVKKNPTEILKTEVKKPAPQTIKVEEPVKKNLSQYSKIVNGQKVPITKEEYDSLMKAGQTVSKDTVALYNKDKYTVVPKTNK